MTEKNYELLDIIRRILEKTDEMRILCDKSFNTLYINPPAKKRYPLLNKRINFRELIDESDVDKIIRSISQGKSASAMGNLTKFAYNPPEFHVIPIISTYDKLEGVIICFRKAESYDIQSDIFDDNKSAAIAAISQEMKYPITMIFTCLDLIKKNLEKNSNEKIKRYFEEITKNSYSLMHYVNHVIETVKNDSKTDYIKYNEYDLCKQLRITCNEICKYTMAQNIEIEVNLPEEACIFYFDAEKIEKALLNILTCAIKYTPANRKITVSLENYDESAIILISGENIRFTENNIDDAYDFTTEGSKLSSYELGIYYAKDIIMRHGGTFLMQRSKNGINEIMFKIPKKYAKDIMVHQFERYTTRDLINQIEKEMFF